MAKQVILKYPVGTELSVLKWKDGVSYWVRGYEEYNPDDNRYTNFRKKIKPKIGCIPIIKYGQTMKPTQHKLENVRPSKKGDSTFDEVFGLYDPSQFDPSTLPPSMDIDQWTKWKDEIISPDETEELGLPEDHLDE